MAHIYTWQGYHPAHGPVTKIGYGQNPCWRMEDYSYIYGVKHYPHSLKSWHVSDAGAEWIEQRALSRFSPRPAFIKNKGTGGYSKELFYGHHSVLASKVIEESITEWHARGSMHEDAKAESMTIAIVLRLLFILTLVVLTA